MLKLQQLEIIKLISNFLAIPDELFDKLQGQKVVNYMKTCKEINISFVPFEDKVKKYFTCKC